KAQEPAVKLIAPDSAPPAPRLASAPAPEPEKRAAPVQTGLLARLFLWLANLFSGGDSDSTRARDKNNGKNQQTNRRDERTAKGGNRNRRETSNRRGGQRSDERDDRRGADQRRRGGAETRG